MSVCRRVEWKVTQKQKHRNTIILKKGAKDLLKENELLVALESNENVVFRISIETTDSVSLLSDRRRTRPPPTIYLGFHIH